MTLFFPFLSFFFVAEFTQQRRRYEVLHLFFFFFAFWVFVIHFFFLGGGVGRLLLLRRNRNALENKKKKERETRTEKYFDRICSFHFFFFSSHPLLAERPWRNPVKKKTRTGCKAARLNFCICDVWVKTRIRIIKKALQSWTRRSFHVTSCIRQAHLVVSGALVTDEVQQPVVFVFFPFSFFFNEVWFFRGLQRCEQQKKKRRRKKKTESRETEHTKG